MDFLTPVRGGIKGLNPLDDEPSWSPVSIAHARLAHTPRADDDVREQIGGIAEQSHAEGEAIAGSIQRLALQGRLHGAGSGYLDAARAVLVRSGQETADRTGLAHPAISTGAALLIEAEVLA
ncbi:MAG: hypothetical protein HYS09_00370 [Chloroflexi bacterium]|nr:hypothetical protein [Chloroflexota bacterium]